MIQWEYEEAVECFNIIETCLKCIYAGETHMCRVLAVQLRILLCEKKPNLLLLRLLPNIKISKLKEIKYIPLNEYNNKNAYLSIETYTDALIMEMPFEALHFFNGIEDCNVVYGNDVIDLEKWVDQVITAYPIPITIRKLIKLVAEKGGGAHVYKTQDPLLEAVRRIGPFKLNIGDLIIIALSKVVQKISFYLIQIYENKESSENIILNKEHPRVLQAAKVPANSYDYPHNIVNLLLILLSDKVN